MSEHTPTPWRTSWEEYDHPPIPQHREWRLITCRGHYFGQWWSTASIPESEHRANCERIVACVNACEGIENPAAIPDLIRAAHDVHFEIADFEAMTESAAASLRSLGIALAALRGDK